MHMADAARKPLFPQFATPIQPATTRRGDVWLRTSAAAVLIASLLAGLAGLQWRAQIDTRRAFFDRFETRAHIAARYVDAYLATERIPDGTPVVTSAIGRHYLSSISPIPRTKAYLLDESGGVLASSAHEGYGHVLEEQNPALATAVESKPSGVVTIGSLGYYYETVRLREAPWTFLVASPVEGILEPLKTPWAVWALLAALTVVAGVTLALLHRVSSARRDLDERVSARTSQLQEANEELEAFAYSVSHDLRAPLRGIDGFAKILADELGEDLALEEQRHLYRIRFNAQRMQELIDDLLRFSRLSRQSLRMEHLDVNKTVNDLRLLMEAETEAVTCRWKIDDLPACRGDTGLVRQIFSNLLDNARKYSAHRDHPVIEVGGVVSGDEVTYHVRDNGVGFDMAYAKDLFGVFQRLHRAEEYPGTGVGLATVQRIVRKHGGRVWAESAPEQGATFYLTLAKG